MVMEVLLRKSQVDTARTEMESKDISCIDSIPQSILRRLHLASGISIGDRIKSWDVLKTINFLEKNVDKNTPILDIGCYASEVIISAHKLGFSDLHGVDLNPDLEKMSGYAPVKYHQANFMQTKFDAESFQAITSVSVIEHGFQSEALLTEMSRILRPGGFFLASFDYWPEKIDTSGISLFGMDWILFSEQEIREFIGQAKAFGFSPYGALNFDAQDMVVKWGGKKYTFAWLVLVKNN